MEEKTALSVNMEQAHCAKHMKRYNERKKALRVCGQLSASIMTPDGVALGLWTFNQAVSHKELMRMIVLHEQPFSLVEYEGFRRFVSSLNPSFKIKCKHTAHNDCLEAFGGREATAASFS